MPSAAGVSDDRALINENLAENFQRKALGGSPLIETLESETLPFRPSRSPIIRRLLDLEYRASLTLYDLKVREFRIGLPAIESTAVVAAQWSRLPRGCAPSDEKPEYR